ncbi:MAG: amidase [Halobacteriales archaeon]
MGRIVTQMPPGQLSPNYFLSISEKLGFSIDKNEREALEPIASQLLSLFKNLDPIPSSRFPSESLPSAPLNDPYNAFIIQFDPSIEYAPETAVSGILDGVRVAVKDNVAIKEYPLTAGSAILSNCTPSQNAILVDKLLTAGSTIVGKTNMDEFAFGPTGETSYFGPTLNPINPDYTPGGSSSGSGASIAANLADVAIGTDTGGSVRIPASFCGVIGLKPTQGAISTNGVVELSRSLDTVGLLGSNLDILRKTLGILSEEQPPSPPRSQINLATLNIGLPDPLYQNPVAPEVSKLVLSIADGLGETGAHITTVDFPKSESSSPIWMAIAMGEIYQYFSQEIFSEPSGSSLLSEVSLDKLDLLSPSLKQYLLAGSQIMSHQDGAVYAEALVQRNQIRNSINKLFDHFDILISPTTPTTAFEFGTFSRSTSPPINHNTHPFNLSGHPAISIPCGFKNGLPIGLQVVGNYGAEYLLLDIAEALLNYLKN